ncbi:MAG: peptidase U32 [Nitrospirae bacterium YQR-1]
MACNFDSALIEGIRGYPVYELYGKMSSDSVGGGRPSFVLPGVGKQRLRDYVKLCRKNGFEFNYLLNSSCMGNTEYTTKGRKSIYELLDFLSDCDVTSVTLNHPLLLNIIKKKKYAFKVRVGIFSGVNTPLKAKSWEDEGADLICLDDTVCNRDFQLLQEIREAVRCRLQLLVNNGCRYCCPYTVTHMNMAAHASQSGSPSGHVYIDYHGIRCEIEKLNNPVNYIRATWIRPEDIKHYLNIGYDNFKIVDRSSSTETLLARVRAYTGQRYQGNLLDLITSKTPRKDGFNKYINTLRYFLNPFNINPWKLIKIKRLLRRPSPASTNYVYIDNGSLDGFIDRFLGQSCRNTDCDKCQYCHRAATRHVVIDNTYKERRLAACSELIDEVEG